MAGAFAFTSGTAYQHGGAAFGFFLEVVFVFVMRSEATNYAPLRAGITFP